MPEDKTAIASSVNTPVSNSSTLQASGGVSGDPKLDWLQGLMIGVVIVLFVGFAGMFVATGAILYDVWNNKAATYRSLEKQIFEQNVKIDSLYQELRKPLVPTPIATSFPQPTPN